MSYQKLKRENTVPLFLSNEGDGNENTNYEDPETGKNLAPASTMDVTRASLLGATQGIQQPLTTLHNNLSAITKSATQNGNFEKITQSANSNFSQAARISQSGLPITGTPSGHHQFTGMMPFSSSNPIKSNVTVPSFSRIPSSIGTQTPTQPSGSNGGATEIPSVTSEQNSPIQQASSQVEVESGGTRPKYVYPPAYEEYKQKYGGQTFNAQMINSQRQ